MIELTLINFRIALEMVKAECLLNLTEMFIINVVMLLHPRPISDFCGLAFFHLRCTGL